MLKCRGSVLAPIKASAHMDKIGTNSLENRNNLYVYKESVGIPPLEMIDDVVSIAKCGVDSTKSNTLINSSIEMKQVRKVAQNLGFSRSLR